MVANDSSSNSSVQHNAAENISPAKNIISMPVMMRRRHSEILCMCLFYRNYRDGSVIRVTIMLLSLCVTAAHDWPRKSDRELFTEYFTAKTKQLRGPTPASRTGSADGLDEIGVGHEPSEILFVQFRTA